MVGPAIANIVVRGAASITMRPSDSQGGFIYRQRLAALAEMDVQCTSTKGQTGPRRLGSSCRGGQRDRQGS